MKLPRIGIPEALLGLSCAGLVALAIVVTARALEPPALAFTALSVINPQVSSENLLYVVAETERRESDCVNGVQIELRDARGAQTRLPIPAREIAGNRSTYAIVIPKGTQPGRYQMLVREIFTCQDGVEMIEAPWLPIEVVS